MGLHYIDQRHLNLPDTERNYIEFNVTDKVKRIYLNYIQTQK